MVLTSSTHADKKTFPVSAVLALSARAHSHRTVARRLTTRELHRVVRVAQKERLQQQQQVLKVI